MLPPCWMIKHCGRGPGGEHEEELGLCPAYPRHGHSCWSVAGTFCGGQVRGTFAQKDHQCVTCEVYQTYSTSFGERREEFRRVHPEEFAECVATLANIRRKPRNQITGEHEIAPPSLRGAKLR